MKALLLIALALSLLPAQEHKTHWVTVEEGVKLEVLEWPGEGTPVVLLTGSGNTAHVYDEFAPKLSGCCHVYAVTRRGFGHSSHPSSGFDNKRLSEDVLQVIHALKIEKPVLIGHSMAGGELTTLGATHSEELSGLIYLDAGADPADFPWSDPAYREAVGKLQKLSPPKPSQTADKRKNSYQAYRAWQLEQDVFAFCEHEVRNMYDFNPDGAIGAYRTPNTVRDAIDRGSVKRDYNGIRVPVLSIFATPAPLGAEARARGPEFLAAGKVENDMRLAFIRRYQASLRKAVPNARILEWPGASHYLFLAQEAQTLQEVHDFIRALR
ncbi:MAG: alpha/beta hydrolase [Acidobacteria bacterium]|nr:alpha/beta hydrolase [Acidobacteriota bacterium]